ncbi:MAG: hypothetical protein LBG79_00125 [Spirochaetaceae bacterium]|jgi:hypothetical protein|nr:hypothetical protein [Spirochaetaceae bacterium]
MPDLFIIELIIAIFLFLPLCKPYIKAFRKVEGFLLLPPLAFICLIALFPAYGFRPECIPLLIYTAVYNILNANVLSASMAKLSYSEDTERGPLYFLVMFFLLIAVEFIALRFLPITQTDTLVNTQSVNVSDPLNNNKYYIRIYDKNLKTSSKPLLIVVPPVLGSNAIVDTLCETLAGDGGMVLCFSRKDFDIPAVNEEARTDFPHVSVLRKSFLSIISGTENKKANIAGRFFESERIKDIEFIVPFAIKKYMPDSVRIAAFGAGGSALVLLCNNEEFNKYGIESAVIIESKLYSLLETRQADTVYNKTKGGVITNFINSVLVWVNEHREKPLEPVNETPSPLFPLEVITADTLQDENTGSNRALLAFVRKNKQVKLNVVPGTGPADFCDAPLKYPFITALLRGQTERIWQTEDSVPKTARLILKN